MVYFIYATTIYLYPENPLQLLNPIVWVSALLFDILKQKQEMKRQSDMRRRVLLFMIVLIRKVDG